MVVFPNAKINIGLHILQKRKDGFHDIESVFYPIPLKDILEIVPAKKKTEDGFVYSQSGIEVDSPAEQNLTVKAYLLLKEKFKLPDVKIHLHKQIPIGAGLGGGSADAAFTLKLLNELFELNLSEKELETYAAMLGSDCAFFVHNKPSLALGRGEILEPLSVSLKNYHLVLVNPGIHISTKEAYAGITPNNKRTALRPLFTSEIKAYKNTFVNDFEASIFPIHPEIEIIKTYLYQKGALYASMSGSGSTVYGIFEEKVTLKADFPEYFVFEHQLE